jgi:hypothetical protein
MLPKFEPSMDSILATQTFLVHFLPISHPQRWIPLSKFAFQLSELELMISLPTMGWPQQWSVG